MLKYARDSQIAFLEDRVFLKQLVSCCVFQTKRDQFYFFWAQGIIQLEIRLVALWFFKINQKLILIDEFSNQRFSLMICIVLKIISSFKEKHLKNENQNSSK